MKIAILGNMNNNGFALMRYLRDLGADAHLVLFANDGTGSLSHFVPNNDTFQLDQWLPFIHQSGITNGFFSLIPKWLQKPIWLLYNVKNLFSGRVLLPLL